MKFPPENLVLFLHVGLILVYAIFILLGKSHLRKEHVVPLCSVPIFGPFVALMIEIMILSGKQGTRSVDMERLALDDEILWSTLRSFHEKGDLVPLEEAILIDEVKVRRKSMLETLYVDPSKYLDVLKVAKYNEDIETSHYATTTISKAQKDFQLSIQKHAGALKHQPDNIERLEIYIEMLRKYIQSGLLEESLLRNVRLEYSKMLNRKLALLENDKNALIEKLRNEVELQEYTSAFDSSRRLRKYWPEDEQTWIEMLRVAVEAKCSGQLKEIIEEIEHRKIIWTDQGKEQIYPWIKTLAP